MLQRFERSNASEIRNGIMFDFYPGLPHVCVYLMGNTNDSFVCDDTVIGQTVTLALAAITL